VCVCDSMTLGGELFNVRAAAIWNARSSTLERRVVGMNSPAVDADRRRRRESTSAARRQSHRSTALHGGSRRRRRGTTAKGRGDSNIGLRVYV